MAEHRSTKGHSPADDHVPVVARMHLWHFQAVRDALFLGALVALIWLGYAMREVTVPLLVALLLAYLFEPLVARLSSHPSVRRPFVVAMLLCTVGLAGGVVLSLAVPAVIQQTTRFVEDVRAGRFIDKAGELRQYVPEFWRDEFDGVLKLLSGRVAAEGSGPAAQESPPAAPSVEAAPPPPGTAMTEARIIQIVEERLAARSPAERSPPWQAVPWSGADTIFRILGAILQIGLLAFLIPFYFFFFSVGFPSVVKYANDLIPKTRRTRTIELIRKMDHAVAGFVRGRIVVCGLMSAMFAGGWMICGVPYALLLGLVTGVFSIVPYLGAIGLPLAVGMLLYGQLGEPEGQRMVWWQIVLWPTLVYVIVQIVEGYILTPLISGKATNLDPVTIVVVVLAGGSVMGVYGMLLAIPVAACAKILITDVVRPRVREWIEGRAEDPLPLGRSEE